MGSVHSHRRTRGKDGHGGNGEALVRAVVAGRLVFWRKVSLCLCPMYLSKNSAFWGAAAGVPLATTRVALVAVVARRAREEVEADIQVVVVRR